MTNTQTLSASERILQSELSAAINAYCKTHPQLDSASQYTYEAGFACGFVRGCARATNETWNLKPTSELSMTHKSHE